MSTEAKRAGNARHITKLDRIVLQPYKAEGQRIRAAASAAGLSVNAFVLECVRDRIGTDEKRTG